MCVTGVSDGVSSNALVTVTVHGGLLEPTPFPLSVMFGEN